MPSSSFNVKRFNELMDLSGLSFREVAAGTGLTTQTVASCGNGKVDPSLSAYIAIVNFLNVPLEYLVEDPSKNSVPRGKKGRSNSRDSSSNLLELSLNSTCLLNSRKYCDCANWTRKCIIPMPGPLPGHLRQRRMW